MSLGTSKKTSTDIHLTNTINRSMALTVLCYPWKACASNINCMGQL